MFNESGLKIAEIETLKSEHEAAQMSLNKEQTSIIAHDVTQLRRDVLQLQNEVGLGNGQDRLRYRLAFLEKDTGDSFGKHAQAMDEFMLSHNGHCASVEARVSNVEDAIHGVNVRELGQLPQRLALLEQDSRDSADRYSKQVMSLQAANNKHSTDLFACREALCKRMSSIEESVRESDPKQMKMIADLQMSYDALLRDWEVHKVGHAPLPERLSILEEQFAETVDKMNKMCLDLAHLQDAAFHGRVASLETELSQLAERQTRELNECQRRHDKATKDVVNLEVTCATISERTTVLERQVGAATGQLTKLWEEHGATRSGVLQDLSTMRELLSSLGTEIECSSNHHTKAIEDVKRTNQHNSELSEARHVAVVQRIEHIQSTLTEFSENLQHWHVELSSTIPDRIAFVEQQQRDSTDKLVKDLQSLQLLRDQFESRFAEIRCESDGWGTSVARRVGVLERAVRGKADQQANELADLRQAHQAHKEHTVSLSAMKEFVESVEMHGSKQVGALRVELLRHRRSMVQRLEACEKLLHRELSSSQGRAHMIATELQKEVDSKAALVNILTRSASSPSVSTVAPETSPSGQSSPTSFTRLSSPLSLSPSRALRNVLCSGELADPPLSELQSPRPSWWA
jgi:hypothetical protein